MKVGDKLGLHDAVTGLAAKLDGLGIMISLVGSDGTEQQEDDAAGDENA